MHDKNRRIGMSVADALRTYRSRLAHAAWGQGSAQSWRAAVLRRLSRPVVVVLTGSVVRGSGANTIKIHRVGTADLSDDPETRRRLRALIGEYGREGGDGGTTYDGGTE